MQYGSVKCPPNDLNSHPNFISKASISLLNTKTKSLNGKCILQPMTLITANSHLCYNILYTVLLNWI